MYQYSTAFQRYLVWTIALLYPRIAAWLAERTALPMQYVRKKPKGFGRDARIEGDIHEGQRVLLVEDLMTDGGSKLSFVEAIRTAGAVVGHTFVIFYYDIFKDAEEQLAAFELGEAQGILCDADAGTVPCAGGAGGPNSARLHRAARAHAAAQALRGAGQLGRGGSHGDDELAPHEVPGEAEREL